MKKILKLIKSIRNRHVNFTHLLKSIKYLNYIVKAEALKVTGTGVLQLFFNTYVVKIPLGKISEENLEKEYMTYLKLKKTNLSKYVDYKLEKLADDVYKIEKLWPWNSGVIDILIEDLESEKTDESEAIELSIDGLNKLCNKEFEYCFKYEKSVMHGDLTPENIMANKSDQIVMIDLDRFTFSGIKGVDRLHFIIEKECKKEKIDFFDWILKYFDTFKNKERLFLYFVYRINSENRTKLSSFYYEKACKVYKKFIEEFS